MTVITSPALRARWQALAPREQTLVLAAGGLVAFALLWWLAAAPALSTLRAAPARHAALTQRLGNTAQLNVVGARATVTLKGAPADALAQWLAQARSNARAAPVEARLTRSAAPAGSAPNAPAPVKLGNAATAMPRWDGTLVLALPPAQP